MLIPKFKNKKILIFILAVILVAGFFSFGISDTVYADPPSSVDDAFGLTEVGETTFLGTDDIRTTIAKIIRGILGFLGIVALGIVLYGGFIYMTAGGSEEKVSTAKKIIINGTIGLAIILASFSITQFIISRLAEATGFVVEGIPTNCTDIAYATANPDECGSGTFNPCLNLDNQFVVKSITPNMVGSIDMNNFAVRVVFSQGLGSGIDADSVFNIDRDGANVNSEFVFSFVDANHRVVEASSGGHDGAFDGGSYDVTVLSGLTSSGGINLETDTTCGTFPTNASFDVNTVGEIDNTPPEVDTILYSGLTYGGTIALPRGGTYVLGTAITDDSGVGYVHLEIQRRNSVDNSAINGPIVIYDGPRVARGSQATLADPYEYNYNLFISGNNPVFNSATEPSYYEVTLVVTDIDHNQTITNSEFIVVDSVCTFGTGAGDAPGCRGGGSCVTDVDCLSGICDEEAGICLNAPVIEDLSPWGSAGGGWLTIFGYYFGNEEGTIEFGLDNNADGDPEVWIPAALASCGATDVWNDKWIIAEIPPNDAELPNNSFSAIRVNHELYVTDPIGNPDFFDTTVNNRGPLPGPNRGSLPGPDVGWFLKNNSLIRPGLCSITPEVGLSGDPVVLTGQDLGAGGAGSALFFGEIQAPVSLWQSDGTQINANVPANMRSGKVGVIAKIDGIESNGVPFSILSEDEFQTPIIESITPNNVTRGSYITISGTRFGGNPGRVYSCNPDLLTDCVELNIILPSACGDTWNNRQIIAEVPGSMVLGEKVIVVENQAGLQSVPGDADRLSVVSGGAMPSICSLSPVSGLAPLPGGHPGIKITGVNFSLTPSIYFWGTGSDVGSDATWLSLAGNPVALDDVEVMTTRIPVDSSSYSVPSTPLVFDNGFSMQSGPIKVVASGQTSNNVVYSVDNCTQIPKNRWPNEMRCCSEGPAEGSFIQEGFSCPGEARTGGYVWRFTTGIIPDLPRVNERCDSEEPIDFQPSPTPWQFHGNGDNVCLNGIVGVEFNMGMDDSTFDGNVKLYTCGTDNLAADLVFDEPDCASNKFDVSGDVTIKYLDGFPGGTLTVRDPSLKGNLLPNTWYRVELLDGILGEKLETILGVPTLTYPPLLHTRTCGNGTAYCFDFKTGSVGSECVLSGISIKPSVYTVNELGPVINRNTGFDLFYSLWGQGNKACTMLPVDGLGWDWTTDDPLSATVTAEGLPYQPNDSLATAYALQEPPLNTVVINVASSTENGLLSADSDLIINLGDPKIIEFWPNCAEACANALIGARFNRQMDDSNNFEDYRNGIHLYECPNENTCINIISNFSTSSPVLPGLPPVAINVLLEPFSDRKVARIEPIAGLKANTSYLVYFDNSIKSVGQIDEFNNIIRTGLPLEPKMWQFKTKADGTFCVADRTRLSPNPFTAYYVGEKTKYMTQSYTNPDQCSLSGQELNPWSFGWEWSSLDPLVADVSNFRTSGQVKDNCNYGCLPSGSDILENDNIWVEYDAEPGSNPLVDVSPPYVIQNDPANGNNYYSMGPGYFSSTDFIPVDTSKIYSLSGLFRSAGVNNSRIYFGLSPYDENFAPISALKVNRYGSDAIVNEVNPAEIKVDASTPINGWNLPNSLAGSRSIGFYYDGDTTKLPDDVVINYSSAPGSGAGCSVVPTPNYEYYCTDPDRGVYSNLTVNTISLNIPIPPAVLNQIQLGVTVIKNHSSGGTYMYSAAGNSIVPSGPSWTEFREDNITGEGFFPANPDIFRTGTKYVRIYLQHRDTAPDVTQLDFDDILFTSTDSDCSDGSCNNSASQLWLCGNGTIDPGEDCDIALENPPDRCTTSCLRPGSDAPSCGNGVVEIDKGEECDTADPATQNGCSSICIHEGSTTDPAEAVGGVALCGSGEVTVGEDCESGLDGEILGITCSSNCLHLGTKISQDWCDNTPAWSDTKDCIGAISVCGNNLLEKGEQCEIIGDKVYIFSEIGTNILTDAPLESCTRSCVLKDICGTNVPSPPLCDPLEEGCSSGCTLLGSSIGAYSESSLCGDGEVGIGEYSWCEYTPAEMMSFEIPGENPIQVATAIGSGFVDPATKRQETFIQSILKRIRGESDDLPIAQQEQLTSNGEYSLLCGFTESFTDVMPYNDCQDNGDNSKGVGYNSCCYERPSRIDEYPIDGQGLLTAPLDEPVCRNTYISVTFSGNIDESTLTDSLILARGYTDAEVAASTPSEFCSSVNGANVSSLVSATLAYGGQDAPVDGFWNNIWNKIKRFFAWLVSTVHASITNDVSISVWCDTGLAGATQVTKLDDGNGNVLESKVGVYINELLDGDSTYAVVMRGGNGGIKNIDGVGIVNANEFTKLNDSILFHTNDKICKIDSVSVLPPEHIFTAPTSAYYFGALAETNDNQFIVPIIDVYDWTWGWGPVLDPIFEIPLFGTPGDADIIQIGATLIEGNRTGTANATVVTDLDVTDSQVGQVFTGETNLTSIFCENPWPQYQYYPYEEGISFGTTVNNDGTDGAGIFDGSALPSIGGAYFNFKMSYCADFGLQDTTVDDLPYLKPFVFTSGFPDPQNLKRFLFFNDINNDAIGIQVFSNLNHDNIHDWFWNNYGDPIGFNSVFVDGYDAITDGNNYYISALNESSPGNLYYNVYLFSINDDAQDNTREVFNKLIDSLKFNINISNDLYCGGDPLRSCFTDYECVDSLGNPLLAENTGIAGTGVCSADRDKMRRDWTRLAVINNVQDKITLPPELKSGTYLPGKTKSMWPSWGTLGSLVGGVGVDELNRWTSCNYCSGDTTSPLTLCSTDDDCSGGLGVCVTVDSQTCWDEVNDRFICPNKGNVLNYNVTTLCQQPGPVTTCTTEAECRNDLRYSCVDNECLDGSDPATACTSDLDCPTYQAKCELDYFLYSPLEYFGDVSSFVDESHFDIRNICEPGVYEEPLLGECGNGVINTGEACDPPGSIMYNAGACIDTDGLVSDKILTCNNACQWQQTGCEVANKCGDRRIDPGEACDDGSLNGTYGHCNIDCSGFSPQYCGDSIRNDDGVGNFLELCDLGAVNGVYGSGCSSDCQSLGPRCGDGILNIGNAGDYCAVNTDCYSNVCVIDLADETKNKCAPFEECDDGNNANDDGCSNICKKEAALPPVPGSGLVAGVCGNGIINEGETCDRGSDPTTGNGIICMTDYGQYCNYCSYDCQEVLYVEPAEFCGNNELDLIEEGFTEVDNVYEACEFIPEVCTGTGCVGPFILNDRDESKPFQDRRVKVDGCSEVSQYDQTLGVNMYNTYTGGYRCADQCTRFENGCNLCGMAELNRGGSKPYVSILNPMFGNDKNSYGDWYLNGSTILPPPGTYNGNNPFMKFYFKEVENGVAKVTEKGTAVLKHELTASFVGPLLETSVVQPEDIFGRTISAGGNNYTTERGVIADIQCNGVYYLCFSPNESSADGSCLETELPSDYLWPYPVNNNSGVIENEYIISTPVPEGSVRIVLRWTLNDSEDAGGGQFGLGILNSNSIDTYMSRLTPVPTACHTAERDSLDYFVPKIGCQQSVEVEEPVGSGTFVTQCVDSCETWTPPVLRDACVVSDDCNNGEACNADGICERTAFQLDEGVYMHSSGNLDDTFVQSMTVNLFDPSTTPDYGAFLEDGPFSVFVEAQGAGGGIPMKNFINGKLRIEIFEYHEIPTNGSANTIFKPDHAFDIKTVGRSSNPNARYWHVFDIIRDDDGSYYDYRVAPVHRIKTGTINIGAGGSAIVDPASGDPGIPVTCGNGVVDPGEVCDNSDPDDGFFLCKADCSGEDTLELFTWCGDGHINGSETCDEGALNGNPGHCNTSCSGIIPSGGGLPSVPSGGGGVAI